MIPPLAGTQEQGPGGHLKIGLVSPVWPGTRVANGIVTVVSHLAAGLEACGHEVTIVALNTDAPSVRERVIGVSDRPWSLFEKLHNRVDPVRAVHRIVASRVAQAVNEAVLRHGVEVVVMEETQGWAGMVRDRVRIPVVATLHGPWWLHRSVLQASDAAASALREAREAAGLLRVDGITSPSRDVMDRTAALWGLPDIPKALIRNPFPLPPDHITPDARSLDRLLFVGRFDLIKGGDVVIEAFSRIAAVNPHCRLTFVGPDMGIPRPDGSSLSLDEALAGLPENVRSRVNVTGALTRHEVAALRCQHGITIVASRYENFSGTLIEAMAAGSAAVSTHVGGCAEIVSHEKTGLLVPSEDPSAMADACLRLMADPVFAARLGLAARNYVAEELAPVTIARALADFLTPLCRK